MDISIIIPIYNVEKYLDECLNSFCKQTNKNFFVLLIDDGSTDDSGKIAKTYVTNYPEMFNYIHQENKGLGGARNTGLSNVKTKYTMFFDSDDFMAPRSMEHILKYLLEDCEKSDIIMFNPVIFNMITDTYEPWHDSWLTNEIFKEEKKNLSVADEPRLLGTEASVCRSIWRTDFIKEMPFRFFEHTA